MDYKHLRSYVFLADELHFGRTAERLAITQSALTAQIQALEASLGVRLLNRGRRIRISLTAAGELFLEEARQVVEQFERARLVGQRAGRGELGSIEIGFVASAVFCGLLGTAVGRFSRKHKDVRIALREIETPSQIESIISGKIDVGFLRSPRMKIPGISFHTLLNEKIVVALPKGHRLASAGKSIASHQLRDEAFAVTLSHNSGGLYDHVRTLGEYGGFEPRIEQWITNLTSLLGVVAAGLSLALVPKSLMRVNVEGVVFRPLRNIVLEEPLMIACRSNEREMAIRELVQITMEIRMRSIEATRKSPAMTA